MQIFLTLLALIALSALIVIASSAVTIAAAVEQHRIQRKREMDSYWSYPVQQDHIIRMDHATLDTDYTTTAAQLESGYIDWRRQLPAPSRA